MSWRDHDTATSHFIASTHEPDLNLHIRAHADDPARAPVLFVHGATYASRLYDIPHPGASWLQATADVGFAAYAVDIRGYGKSHSQVMDRASTPYARAADAIEDIGDAIEWCCARHNVETIRLVGGSWGSVTTALYTSTQGASRVDRLVLYAPIYAERNAGWQDFLADPDDRSRVNPAFGPARPVTEAATRARWDAEIPQRAEWRDEAVFQALVQSSLADDPSANRHDPPAFRAPNGTFLDLWEVFNGRPLYDPGAIRCPTLLIRGGVDPTSARTDALRLFDLIGAEEKQYVEIANGAHFVSAEKKAQHVFDAVNQFLRQRF